MGKSQTRLTNSNANNINAMFGPDSQSVIYQSDRNGNWDIFLLNKETKCNFFLWFQRNLKLKTGKPTPGHERNFAAITALTSIGGNLNKTFTNVADNLNPVGRVYYAASAMICTPASLSQEVGLGLGAQAGEARLKKVAKDAGFSKFRRAAETPFNLVFEARA